MSRFAFPEKYAMRLIENGKGGALAYFNIIDTETGIEYRDVRLIQGKNGVFVSAPFRSYEAKGETKYADYWRASFESDGSRSTKGVAFVEEMAQVAYARYEQEAANGGGNSAPASASGSGQRKAAGGRGPLASAPTTGEKKPELPF